MSSKVKAYRNRLENVAMNQQVLPELSEPLLFLAIGHWNPSWAMAIVLRVEINIVSWVSCVSWQ